MSMRLDDSGGRGAPRPPVRKSYAPRSRGSIISPVVPKAPNTGYQGPPSVTAGRTLPSPIVNQGAGAPPAPSFVPRGGGGAGGGGGGPIASMIAPSAPTITLEDFIQDHFLRRQTENENARGLEDFDAESLRLRQETEADMRLRQQDLQRDLDDAGLENAGSFAARGLDRSGLVFQGQDRINAEGARRGQQIQEMLTSLLGDRGRGRVERQRSGEALLNQRIAELTRQFNDQNQAPLAF